MCPGDLAEKKTHEFVISGAAGNLRFRDAANLRFLAA